MAGLQMLRGKLNLIPRGVQAVLNPLFEQEFFIQSRGLASFSKVLSPGFHKELNKLKT